MRSKLEVSVSWSVFLIVSLALLILPIRWVLAWLFAVAVHEMGHFLSLKAMKVPIYSVSISQNGAIIASGELSGAQELICGLSGPLAGLGLTLLSRWLPCCAVCAFLQSLFNLLPIYPLDGGRAVRVISTYLTGTRCTAIIEKTILFIMCAMALYIIVHFHLSGLGVACIFFVFAEKFLAKRRKKSYNRGKHFN